MARQTDGAILPGMESTLTASGKELAEWLCVTPAAVSQWAKSGKIRPIDGREDSPPVYPLKESVQSIVREWRGRRKAAGEGSKDLERSLKYWKVERTKQAVLQWRMSFGKNIALSILDRLESSLAEFQKEVGKENPRINAVILRLAGALREARYEDYGMEGEDDLEGLDDGDGATED